MIALQCSHCGHEIQISDSMRGREIRCARCGAKLAVRSDAEKPESAVGATPVPSGPQAATSHSGSGETLIPGGSKGDLSFSFLSPAKGPGEIGWLEHFRVVRVMGHGGMGIVFYAIDTRLERAVALKVMRPECAADKVSHERFLREARAMAAVKSDHVVTVHDVGQSHNLPFLAMELLEGESLRAFLEHSGPLEFSAVVDLGLQIARGLAAAHQRGLIHRDITPANIFLVSNEGSTHEEELAQTESTEGDAEDDLSSRNTAVRPRFQLAECRVKILDFGLARALRERSPLTEPGVVVGTPGYMAPEQLEGRELDARCDLFSLGALLYEMTTGEAPFTANNPMAALMAAIVKKLKPPRELRPDVPKALNALIEKLLEKDAKDRPASANEVVAALEALAKTLGAPSATSKRHQGSVNRESLASPHRRRLLFAVVLVAAVTILLIVWRVTL